MQVYLVGGAVRDELLQLPITEQDWVVVGATAEVMLAQGYQLVGKDFPVFLHPTTKAEYALARTERKIGPGYKGFRCYAAADVTLEDDLRRRDLTINAIAKDSVGNIIDPVGGCDDLAARVLRHVSPLFIEDPVRVLRLARFAARFAKLGFTVAPETQVLVRQMVAQGELAHLVNERVWQETQRALAESQPEVFFEVLKEGDALASIFPEIAANYSKNLLLNLQNAARLSPHPGIRWASLLQAMCFESARKCCQNLHVPSDYTQLAFLALKYCDTFQHCQQVSPEALLNFLQAVDAFRRPQRFNDLLTIWRANSKFNDVKQQLEFLLQAQQLVMKIDIKSIVKGSSLTGVALKTKINAVRLAAISHR